MSNAREIVALRNRLHAWLEPADLRDIHWPTVTNAAVAAVDRGWTGDEIARWCIADLGSDVDNAGAVMVTTIRGLAATDPPRETTPTPVAMSEHQKTRAQAIRDAAGVDHGGWVERVKAQHAARRRENAR